MYAIKGDYFAHSMNCVNVRKFIFLHQQAKIEGIYHYERTALNNFFSTTKMSKSLSDNDWSFVKAIFKLYACMYANYDWGTHIGLGQYHTCNNAHASFLLEKHMHKAKN